MAALPGPLLSALSDDFVRTYLMQLGLSLRLRTHFKRERVRLYHDAIAHERSRIQVWLALKGRLPMLLPRDVLLNIESMVFGKRLGIGTENEMPFEHVRRLRAEEERVGPQVSARLRLIADLSELSEVYSDLLSRVSELHLKIQHLSMRLEHELGLLLVVPVH